MSSALALAAVTHVLKDLLNEGIINSVLAGNVRVTAQPPIRDPQPTTAAQSQLNLFLYHVTLNPAGRNRGLPAFDAAGNRSGNPPLAVDLHYLVTAYDERDLHAEILLGYALQLLHEHPVLSRQAIRRSLTTDLPAGTIPPSLPPELRALTQAGLADQLEAIKITPQVLNTEEMSKLWTAFQAPYRPSAAYLVTVVLIESRKSARSAPPVLRIGEDARGPRIEPSLLAPFPTLLAQRSPNYQPAARAGGTLHLFGHHLAGTNPLVRLRHAKTSRTLTVPGTGLTFTAVPRRDELGQAGETFELPDEVSTLADQRVRVDLSQAVDPGLTPPAANWAAGFYTVELQLLPAGESAPRSTNALPLMVTPEIRFDAGHTPVVTAPAVPPDRAFRPTSIRLESRPAVHLGQSVSLVLGGLELPGQPVLVGAATSSETLEFSAALPVAMFAPVGTPPQPPRYLARLRVDGIESASLVLSPPEPPGFDPTQFIALP